MTILSFCVDYLSITIYLQINSAVSLFPIRFSADPAAILVVRVDPVDRVDRAEVADHVDPGAARAANFAEAFYIGTANAPAAMASNTIARDPNARAVHAA